MAGLIFYEVEHAIANTIPANYLYPRHANTPFHSKSL
jgi:hypothetical protein